MRARSRSCVAAGVSRRSRPGGARLPGVAARPRTGLCAGRLPRLLDLASGRRRHDRAEADSPRKLCDGRLTYVRPCWYRYFLERPLALPVRDAADLRRDCRGLRGLERSGCISAAALTISSNPFDQMHVCERLGAADASACLRGVPDQALAGRAPAQLRLIRACSRITVDARAGCYEWLGRTLSVVRTARSASEGARS